MCNIMLYDNKTTRIYLIPVKKNDRLEYRE